MVGLSLVAVMAIAAITASSASALEWGKCVAKAGGNYTGPNCGKSEKAKPKGTGTFEYLKASQVGEKRVAEGKSKNVPFAGESVGGGGVLSTSTRECEVEEGKQIIRATRQKCEEEGGTEKNNGSLTVECAKENNTGEAEANNKVANVHVVFTGCASFGVLPCQSEGKAEGEIETEPLKGKLGWINKSAKEVGVVLEPAKKKGHFAEFECAGLLEIFVGVGNNKEGAEYTDTGCFGPHEPPFQEGCPGTPPTEEKHGGYDQIISPITPVNKMTSEFTQEYTANINGTESKNIPDHLQGKHISLLEDYVLPEGLNEIPNSSSDWNAAAEEITNVNTPEEEGMIKA